ncbi:MAG: preprotein translocase subunit SecE [Paracoccus sp. (in: a-proteobacteria)]|nr:preprotein translocase subunit SecE [Paracoccus sp. (in: a-proteobacteria)]
MANPVQFINQVRAEAAKIVWPNRREVITTSIMVVIFSTLAAVFFFAVDWLIRIALSGLLNAVS